MIADHERVTDEEEETELEQQLEQLEDESAQSDRETEEEEPLAEARYLDIIAAVEAMLDRDAVRLDELGALSDDERESLELLQHIISGRTASNTIMYAEERLQALNHVLAQLQPALAVGGAHEVLRGSLVRVVDGFAELRDRLKGLEDAEEEVFHDADDKAAAGESDEDDPDDGKELSEEARLRKAARKAAEKAAKEKAAKAAAEKAGTKPAAKPKIDAGEPGGDQPRPSAVWDPDDRGGDTA